MTHPTTPDGSPVPEKPPVPPVGPAGVSSAESVPCGAAAAVRAAVDAERRRVRHDTVAQIVKSIFHMGNGSVTPDRLALADDLMAAGADPDAVWSRLIEGAPL